MENKLVKCGKLNISNSNPFTLIAGPCQLENEKHALSVASELKEITKKEAEKLLKEENEKYMKEEHSHDDHSSNDDSSRDKKTKITPKKTSKAKKVSKK